MNIQNNINKLSNIQPVAINRKDKEVKTQTFSGNSNLPSLYTAGQSQVNTNLPVNYNKIGEVAIPGLKDKALIYKLANGQKIIIAPKKGPTLVKTTYNVGSINEPDNIRGMSHYIEHNLFNGSKNLAPKEYDLKVSELGGDTNASTSFSSTDYHLQLQLINDNSLEEAIKLNAEQTQYPTFPVEQLIKEKEPVKSEIDMCNDDAETTAVCKTLKNLFKIQTNCEDFVIGTKENINSFDRDKVIDYFNTWYTPDNAVTVITGDVEPTEAIELVSKYYNKQNDYSHLHKRYNEPLQCNDKPIREDIIKSNTTQPSITMGFAIPEGTNQAEISKLDALFSIMKSTDSSLYKSLDKLGASVDFTIENMQNKPNGAKAIIVTAYAPEEKLEDTIKTIYYEIAKISNNPPSFTELNNVKKILTNALLSSTESTDALNKILTYSALNNNYDFINSTIADYTRLTPFDISQTARKYLDLNKISMCVSHENNSTIESVKKQYNKNQVSFGKKISPIDNLKEEKSKITNAKLPNNIQTTVIAGNTYGKSCILLDFHSDELNNTKSPEFLLLNEMLNRGSLLKGAENFNNILNTKDISVTLNTDTEGLSVIAESSSENLQDNLSLIKEKLLYPNLTEEEFKRAKEFIREYIKAEPITAYDKLNQELFPSLNKYADKEEKLQQLEKLTLKDIQNLYAKIFNTARVQAVLTAPVDVNPELASIFYNGLSHELPVFKDFYSQENPNYNIYTPNNTEKILIKEREQAQAQIVQAYKYKQSKNIDDIAKISLLNMILGAGGMSSRLFLDLRENQKLAYSVGSSNFNEKDTGTICLKIGTTTLSPDSKEGSSANVTKALEGFKHNVELLKTQNVSTKELENAKIKFKTSILNNYETNRDKSLSFLLSKYTSYGIDYHEKLFEAIDKITPDDIRKTAGYVFQNPPITSIAACKQTLEELKLM